MLGEEHPDTLDCLHSLAVVYKSQGENARAEELLLECLEKRKRVLGDEHPSTLTCRKNLASVVCYKVENYNSRGDVS